jgi:ATP-dependent Lon protease
MSLERAHSESGILRTYLEILTTLPFGVSSSENLDIDSAKVILDKHHYGMSDVKDRILEFIAVGKLRNSV